eukprot:5317733-Alexandrium_andersonii.AAC.1
MPVALFYAPSLNAGWRPAGVVVRSPNLQPHAHTHTHAHTRALKVPQCKRSVFFTLEPRTASRRSCTGRMSAKHLQSLYIRNGETIWKHACVV